MTKIYRTTDNNYVTIVAHDTDLTDGDSVYSGAFEYSIAQDVVSGEWELFIFDLADEESLPVDDLRGINSAAVSELVNASRGDAEYEEISHSDYYDRSARFVEILEDDVLMEAVVAEYEGRIEA